MSEETKTVEELLPCPFCGGKAERCRTDPDIDEYFIECSGCEASSGSMYGSTTEASKAWNTRSNTAERERREAAEKALAVAENCLQRYADQDMWEFTYSRRLGGSCGSMLHGHHAGHSCTKSEFMSKSHGWRTAQIALQQIADLKESK